MFDIYKDKSGKFRFRLKAKNGEIICASQSYTTKSSCTKGAKSLILNSKKKKSLKFKKIKQEIIFLMSSQEIIKL